MKKLLLIMIAQFIFISAANAVVNINTATLEELKTLPGITTSKAKALIEYRSKAGKFRRVEEVKYIEGINSSTMDMVDFYNSVKLKD
jgi:competence protein ComEA